MLIIFGLLFTYAANCGDNARVRKEIRDLTTEEWQDYKQAVRAMQKDGSYERLAQLHVDTAKKTHLVYTFLIFHRRYLFEFEDELRKHTKNPNATIPFYAAFDDSITYGKSSIDKSPAFSEEYFGAGPGDGSCVKATEDTIFVSANTTVGGKHCITRDFDRNQSISTREDLTQLIVGVSNFKMFTNLLEGGYHREIHMFINGDMGHVWSVNDPILFSHHSLLDYVYDEFQLEHNHYSVDDIPGANETVPSFTDDSYEDIHKNKHFCASYQPYSGVKRRPEEPEDTIGKLEWDAFKKAVKEGKSDKFLRELSNGARQDYNVHQENSNPKPQTQTYSHNYDNVSEKYNENTAKTVTKMNTLQIISGSFVLFVILSFMGCAVVVYAKLKRDKNVYTPIVNNIQQLS